MTKEERQAIKNEIIANLKALGLVSKQDNECNHEAVSGSHQISRQVDRSTQLQKTLPI